MAGYSPFCPFIDYQFQFFLREGERLDVDDYYGYSLAWLTPLLTGSNAPVGWKGQEMKLFIICTVRNATTEYQTMLEDYVRGWESKGHSVHLPHRDTNQNAKGIDICRQNMEAMKAADEVHIFYNPESQGTHFDMGVAFALGRKLVVVENVDYGPGKSYPRMLDEWAGRI